jgi:serine/threonine-protein kinase RsbT
VAEGSRDPERRLTLRDESDIVVARRHVRELGERQRLSRVAVEALATAVTEIARNVIVHAESGEVYLRGERAIRGGVERGLVVVVVKDGGPGIPNVEAAMVDGFSTGVGLGMGLPGARRMVDSFEIASAVGQGTTITLEKWAEPPSLHLGR